MGFIRTGFLGTKVCLGRGAIVLPVFHEVSWISLETMKLIVSRARDQAILTSDNIRVDITTELYTHVGHTADSLLTASRTLGEKTFDADKVRNLMEAKVVSALRSYAATKTLNELHEDRDTFALGIKDNIIEAFSANGLTLVEVTIVTLEQTGKEYFKTDNVFDAEGLKIITEITSDAKRRVHETEKRTTVSIRQKDLDTQLELLEIERLEAFARANQDKEVSNEQALQLGEKQKYVLDQRRSVEEREIETEKTLEQQRSARDVTVTEEAKKRETSEIHKDLALEMERKEKEIELSHKERERQRAEIERATAVLTDEESARDARHSAAEEATLAMRKRALETKLATLELDKQEEVAAALQEQAVSNEKARAISEKQRFILEQRWEVDQEEIGKALAFERAQLQKDAQIIEENAKREVADVRRTTAVEIEERERDIALIAKDQEREIADIQRFLAREIEEREREIALTLKTRELELVEVERLQSTAERERAAHQVDSVRIVADAERDKEIDRIVAEKMAASMRIDEENKAQVNAMHLVSQSEARKRAAAEEADATLTRARANSDAQKFTAEGIEKEAGAKGRAEMEIETLRVGNTQLMLEAEAAGIEAKADALKKYDDAATFLELAKLHIEAERDIHIDQAKAMGNALQNAQIRMYGGGGGGGDGDGTMDTIRGLFTSGFGLGEVLEGVAQSLPEGLRSRFAENGIRGLFGRPYRSGQLKESALHLAALVNESMGTRKARSVPFAEAIATLSEAAGDDPQAKGALALLDQFNEQGAFDDVPFDTVWALVQAMAKSSD
jgi:uncharacterized membrane protein YqiK